jgi:putative tricarboxylic transport membrane protein
MILTFCAIGVYSLSNTTFDVFLMVLFGGLGYVFKKLDCEPAPMLLGYILGPMMEEYLRRTLLIAKGDPHVLITRPISAALLGLALILLGIVLLPSLRASREAAFKEG